MSPLRDIGTEFEGAWGASIVVRPAFPGDDDFDRTADRSYPITAMFVACGWSGSGRTTDPVNSGHHEDADYGAIYGLRVGGQGGHAYIGHGARSKFQTGALLADWTHNGLDIAEPHPDFFGPAIRVRDGAGVVTLGLTDANDATLAAVAKLHVGYQGTANLKLYSASWSNKKTGIDFGGVVLFGTDPASGNVNRMTAYHGPSTRTAFSIEPTGYFALPVPPNQTQYATIESGVVYVDFSDTDGNGGYAVRWKP